MMIEVDIQDLNTVYEASLSACDNCTSDDCGICGIRKAQDKVSELLRERNTKL